MKQIRIQNMVLGMVATNCYLLQNPETKEMIIVDPADNADAIERKINALEGIPVAILLTHGHFDHILAATTLQKKYRISVYAFESEERVLEQPELNLSTMAGGAFRMKADILLKDNEEFQLAGYRITVLHTPGHTEGSCCYYFKDEQVLISGDTLFAGSCGRTDFPTSSTLEMISSLRKLVTELPEETAVYPGHNEATTIGEEKRYNPFIRL